MHARIAETMERITGFEDLESEERWALIRSLHVSKNPSEVVDGALRIAESGRSVDVIAALDIVAQVPIPEGDQRLGDAVGLIRRCLLSSEELVVASAVYSAMHRNPGDLGEVLPLATHSSSLVREAVAAFLHNSFVEQAIECMLALADDESVGARNWALTALARLPGDEVVLVALVRGAFDSDDETRHEAILGVAKRSPVVARGFIGRELRAGCVSAPILEAVSEAPHRSFLSDLRRLERMGEEGSAIEEAVSWCEEKEG